MKTCPNHPWHTWDMSSEHCIHCGIARSVARDWPTSSFRCVRGRGQRRARRLKNRKLGYIESWAGSFMHLSPSPVDAEFQRMMNEGQDRLPEAMGMPPAMLTGAYGRRFPN